jgi:SAM-dependent methyltransferase
VSGPRTAILKRWHALTVRPGKARRRWEAPYWTDQDGFREISCRQCRRFDQGRARCSISYGSPMRKCAAAAIEANLSSVKNAEVLEIGFGRWKLARRLLERNGCRWTGIDPGQTRERKARLGHGGYGHAARIPFGDETFDFVFGVQTLEHWGQKAGAIHNPSRYADCLAEVHRVLKPEGLLYLDAPIHYHGHEMFVMGDLDKIRALFDGNFWTSPVFERWRLAYEPLERFVAPEKEYTLWPTETGNHRLDEIERIVTNRSAWVLTCKAQRRMAS